MKMYFYYLEQCEKELEKLRRIFRVNMGKKTIKIDGLQHFKLTTLKTYLINKYDKQLSLGDTIEFLIDKYNEELKNESK